MWAATIACCRRNSTESLPVGCPTPRLELNRVDGVSLGPSTEANTLVAQHADLGVDDLPFLGPGACVSGALV